jgi:DNA-binding beta-propeller fold protein YncE
MRPRLYQAITAAALSVVPATAPLYAQSYHVAKTFTLGGDGGWDYVTLDTVGHRLFVARQDRVMVIDPTNGKLLAEIPGLNRAHGVAFSYATGKGFATSGGDSSVVVFDLKSLKVLSRTTAAVDADAVLFDPATKHVFTFNGDAGSSSVIDPASGQRIGNIDLGGKPEFGVSTGDGRLYVNIEDSSVVAEVDPVAMKVTRRWSLAPCESPTGLAIDRAHSILFSGCRSGVMAISDAKAGKLITTVPIGQGVDAARFDPATQLAFASNGEGTITVIHQDAPDKFTVVQTVQTKRGARTMELDLKTHRLFTVSADFGPPPAPTAERPRPRPPILPGTFAVLELDP